MLGSLTLLITCFADDVATAFTCMSVLHGMLEQHDRVRAASRVMALYPVSVSSNICDPPASGGSGVFVHKHVWPGQRAAPAAVVVIPQMQTSPALSFTCLSHALYTQVSQAHCLLGHHQ